MLWALGGVVLELVAVAAHQQGAARRHDRRQIVAHLLLGVDVVGDRTFWPDDDPRRRVMSSGRQLEVPAEPHQALLWVPFVVLRDVGLHDPQSNASVRNGRRPGQAQRADGEDGAREQDGHDDGRAPARPHPVMNKGAVRQAAATVSRLSP